MAASSKMTVATLSARFEAMTLALTARIEALEEQNAELTAEVERAHVRLDECSKFLQTNVVVRIRTLENERKPAAPPMERAAPVDSDPALPVYGSNGNFYQFVKVGNNRTTRRPVHGPARRALTEPAPASKASAPSPASQSSAFEDDDCPF